MKVTEILREWNDYSPDAQELGSKYHAIIRSNPWRAKIVDVIKSGDSKVPAMDFEVEVTNPLTGAKLYFVVRPADTEPEPAGVSVENFDVRDLQTGKTQHWTSGYGMPLHWAAVWDAFSDEEFYTKILPKLRRYYTKLGIKNRYGAPTAPKMQGLSDRPAGFVSYSADDALGGKANDQLKKMGNQPPETPEKP